LGARSVIRQKDKRLFMEQAALPQAVRFFVDGSPERSSVKRVQPACADLQLRALTRVR
jgi:hypothetical protein